MIIKKQPMGPYQTNCYIVSINEKDFIIDPGVGALEWIQKEVKNPIAILNTHGHFDHVWSNQKVKEALKIPIYVPKEDAFMLEKDPFGQGTPPSKPDILIEGDEVLMLEGVKIEYIHFHGHTPGNSAIMIEDGMFSGDFIFENSIGRVDFPYSKPDDMKKSIKKFLTLKEDKTIYPGHGNNTSIKVEQSRVGNWLNYI
jgi:glyoxylase-like metal-dependent hydrolase (beta-lactamase superfamily II)